MASIYDKQIKNRNFLSPTGFKFIMDKATRGSFFVKIFVKDYAKEI